MPVEFLTDEQIKSYGQFCGEPSDEQLARYFHLDDTDKNLIKKLRGDYNRLGFGIQLGTVRFLGTFLSDPSDIPWDALLYVSRQLGIENPSCIHKYGIGRTHWDHIAKIKQRYGYRDFTDRAESFGIVRWLYNRCTLSNERPSILFDLATARLVERKVLLPGATTLARLVARVRDRAAKNLWSSLSNLTIPLQQKRLEWLLDVSEDDRQSHLDRLRQGPTNMSGKATVAALERIEEIRNLGVSDIDLSPFPLVRIKALAQYAHKSTAHNIRRMPQARKTAILLAFAQRFERIAVDDALDLMDAFADKIFREARDAGKKKRMRTLRDLDNAALNLHSACELILDENIPPERLREAIFSQISRSQLQVSAICVEELARPKDDNYEQEIMEKYRTVRKFMPKLLKTIRFEAASSGQRVLKALEFLVDIEGQKKPDMSKAPMTGVPKAWQRRIIDENGKINRQAYTLCTLERLQFALRRRDVFVPTSTKWSDPRKKLISAQRWKSLKPKFCHSLGQPKSGEGAAKLLAEQLNTAYKDATNGLDENAALCLHPANESRNFKLSSLDRVDDPESLVRLRHEISARLPRVDLPEVLLEIHALTGFADEFIHISEHNARADGLVISLCATLLSQACNTGLDPVIDRSFLPLTRHRLSWTLQNYIRAETLTKANARLVDWQTSIPLANMWGGGEIASADGMRFVVPVQSIHAGPNKKYFGRGRGVTYYNFTSDQFTGFHHIVVPGTLRDSMYILEGLLEHETSLKVKEIMSDTAGTSEIVFGLFWLLGYQFSPRLADIASSRFWRIDPHADYGALNSLSRNKVKPDLFIRQWDDVLRTAASLKTGTISASELIRSLFNSKRPSTLGKAIAELGKIPKTAYMLNYISDENYRRRILIQLNRGENRHSLGREVYHGRKGELRQRYKEGQEDQLGALGLVLNALVLWNTVYMQEAINQLEREGYKILPEDMARLSPLIYEHFNFLGRYSFRLEGPPAEGKLRPLRNPNEQQLLAA